MMTAREKLARAARLHAQAAALFVEAAEELERATPEPPPAAPPVTEVDKARARRALRRLGRIV